MKKFKNLFIIIFIIAIDKAHSQDLKMNETLIYLDIVNEYIYLNNIDTITDHKKNIYIITNMSDSIGTMTFKKYNDAKLTSLDMEGSYFGTSDTMVCRLPIINPDTYYEEYKIRKYFHPLRNGVWKSYKEGREYVVGYYWDMGKLLDIGKIE